MESTDDFLLRKARRRVEELPSGSLRLRLGAAAEAYAAALAVQALDPGRVDLLADDLEDLLEEAEAALSN